MPLLSTHFIMSMLIGSFLIGCCHTICKYQTTVNNVASLNDVSLCINKSLSQSYLTIENNKKATSMH